MKTVETVGRHREIHDNPDEILDTESMIFRNFIGQTGVLPPAEGASQTSASGERLSGLIRNAASAEAEASSTTGYEEAMLVLMDIRDRLIDIFPDVSSDSRVYNLFTDSIHKLEQGLIRLGSDTDRFNPLSHLSGLSGNKILQNANEVAKNTQDHYSLHALKSITANVEKGVPCISIAIEGEDEGTNFIVTGKIYAPEDFTGSEAIDFVNNDGQGLLSVKAISLGRWQDVSDRFDIRWDISPLDDSVEQEEPSA